MASSGVNVSPALCPHTLAPPSIEYRELLLSPSQLHNPVLYPQRALGLRRQKLD